ncbi:hypothetical protein V8F33_001107 [Rhypophila sp. PSN 637]
MTRTQQPSILSFFQPKSLPQHAAPPSNGSAPPKNTGAKESSQPPPAPPLPAPSVTSQRQPSPSVPVSTTITTVTLPARIPVLPSPPSLPSQASIVPIEEHHISALRRINSLLLPVAYPDSFYARVLDPLASGLFSRVILWKDDASAEAKVVGGVVCRIEPNQFVDQDGRPRALPPPPPPKSTNASNQASTTGSVSPPNGSANPFYAIYIQSLALLSPYRSQGLAAAALEHIVASAAILPAAGSSIDARTLYAHVWTENEEGLRWYAGRGFRREGRLPIPGYYFKLRPDTAWIMRRDIGPSATLAATLPKPVVSPFPSSVVKNGVMASAINLPSISSSSAALKPPPPAGPPRQLSATSASSAASSSLSFQNARPETEWNDLPEEMVARKPAASANSSNTDLLSPAPPVAAPGVASSTVSSRSSSTARKKDKKRAYPAAAFGQ